MRAGEAGRTILKLDQKPMSQHGNNAKSTGFQSGDIGYLFISIELPELETCKTASLVGDRWA